MRSHQLTIFVGNDIIKVSSYLHMGMECEGCRIFRGCVETVVSWFVQLPGWLVTMVNVMGVFGLDVA